MTFVAPSLTPLAVARHAAAALLWSAAGLAQAGIVPFSAEINGVSQIIEVIDPAIPVVSIQTLGNGPGSPGPLTYRSADHINLATGQGSGTNRFTTDAGDELFGELIVQVIPGADASLFDLIGEVFFTGGTGDFAGATGHASFTGGGQFFSATEARTHFVFGGRVTTVDEPGSVVLGALALGLCGLWRRQSARSVG
jgi:hypothetical protein